MSTIKLQCPIPGCTYETGSVSEPVAVALLTAHTTVHSTAPSPVHNAPKLERPRIDMGISAEDWQLFENRWELFKKSSNIPPEHLSTQLFQCATQQLGDATLRLERDVSKKSEKDLLLSMKSLAVIPVATMVRRAELLAMRQNRGEPFRSFFVKVRGKADICSYSMTCKCECGKSNYVDFREVMIRDVIVAGIYDEDIRRKAMGVKNLCEKPINEIVSFVETEEMARDSIPQRSNSTQHTDGYKTQASTAATNVKTQAEQSQKGRDEQRKKIACPLCHKLFYPYKKGRFGWNKKPHDRCTECFSSMNKSQPEESNNYSFSVHQMSSTSQKAIRKQSKLNQPSQPPCVISPLQLSHHIFDEGKWKESNFMNHPRVDLTLSVDQRHYSSFGMRAPSISKMSVSCIADSGAQSNLWSLKACMQMGFTEKDLIPVKSTLVAANKSGININGAILLTLSGVGMNGKVVSCPAMVYISSMVNEFYLCQECMHKLGIIAHNFPGIGDALTQHTCLETNEAICYHIIHSDLFLPSIKTCPFSPTRSAVQLLS